jgi:hypothetical protein
MTKISEIKILYPDGFCLIRPTSTHLMVNGRPIVLDAALAKQIWKEAVPWIEKFVTEIRKQNPGT